MYKILAWQWRNDPKKLKNLKRASIDPTYKKVLSPEADAPKIELFREFRKQLHKDACTQRELEREVDSMWEHEVSIEDGATNHKESNTAMPPPQALQDAAG